MSGSGVCVCSLFAVPCPFFWIARLAVPDRRNCVRRSGWRGEASGDEFAGLWIGLCRWASLWAHKKYKMFSLYIYTDWKLLVPVFIYYLPPESQGMCSWQTEISVTGISSKMSLSSISVSRGEDQGYQVSVQETGWWRRQKKFSPRLPEAVQPWK